MRHETFPHPHERHCPERPFRDHAIAFTWGLAEGTFFFIVPDVWLSQLALRSPRRAYAASVSAVVGALAGGVATYFWGRRLCEQESRRLLATLPAISHRMIDTVETEMSRGMNRMVIGPLSGTPYKIYARTAGLRGDHLASFLFWSVPARIPRFLLIAVGTSLAARLGRKTLRGRRPAVEKLIFLAGWVGFYTWFFRTVGRDTHQP